MNRTILDFNAEYVYKLWRDEVEEAAKPSVGSFIKNIFFYIILIGVILAAFVYTVSESGVSRIGPYSFNNVLTWSMDSVYPKGSLVVAKDLEDNEQLSAGLANGDDIVFFLEDGRIVVHRIIEIMENFEGEGRRAFRTQGVDNPDPDNWIIYENSIAGRVVWHVAGVGEAMAFVAENVVLIVASIVGLFILLTLLRVILSSETSKKKRAL